MSDFNDVDDQTWRDEPELDMRVEVVFTQLNEAIFLPQFRPAQVAP